MYLYSKVELQTACKLFVMIRTGVLFTYLHVYKLTWTQTPLKYRLLLKDKPTGCKLKYTSYPLLPSPTLPSSQTF